MITKSDIIDRLEAQCITVKSYLAEEFGILACIELLVLEGMVRTFDGNGLLTDEDYNYYDGLVQDFYQNDQIYPILFKQTRNKWENEEE